MIPYYKKVYTIDLKLIIFIFDKALYQLAYTLIKEGKEHEK